MIPENFIYFSLNLTQNSIERLENYILQNKTIQGIIQKREKTIKKYLHHCTLLHKEGNYPSSVQLKTYLYLALKEIFEKEIGKIWKIKVIGWGWNNKALALLVDKNILDLPRCEGHKYHITVCTFNGGRPVESNNISVWDMFKTPIEVDCILVENTLK